MHTNSHQLHTHTHLHLVAGGTTFSDAPTSSSSSPPAPVPHQPHYWLIRGGSGRIKWIKRREFALIQMWSMRRLFTLRSRAPRRRRRRAPSALNMQRRGRREAIIIIIIIIKIIRRNGAQSLRPDYIRLLRLYIHYPDIRLINVWISFLSLARGGNTVSLQWVPSSGARVCVRAEGHALLMGVNCTEASGCRLLLHLFKRKRLKINQKGSWERKQSEHPVIGLMSVRPRPCFKLSCRWMCHVTRGRFLSQ